MNSVLSAHSAYFEFFPVLRSFGEILPDAVQSFLKMKQKLMDSEAAKLHASCIARAQLETPMMKQFAQAKDSVPDALLFFRMGDFYELFGLDAVIASGLCRLTLTSRDKNSDDPVAMAGVPVVSYRSAIKKCVESGFKVAICDQVEDPKDTKLLVKREIVRVVTPSVSGDLFDEDEASPSGSFLVSVRGFASSHSIAKVSSSEASGGQWTVGAVDAATGDFKLVTGQGVHALYEELLALAPREMILPNEDYAVAKKQLLALFQRHAELLLPSIVNAGEHIDFQGHTSKRLDRSLDVQLESTLAQIYSPDSESFKSILSLSGGVHVSVSLFNYLVKTQRTSQFHWKPVRILNRSNALYLDSATRLHLNLISSDGKRNGKTLFDFMNHCVTASGRRKLYDRIASPFALRVHAQESLDATEALVSIGSKKLSELRVKLGSCCDLDRLLSRLVQGQGAARDLFALRRTLNAAFEAGILLSECESVCQVEQIARSVDLLKSNSLSMLSDILVSALSDAADYTGSQSAQSSQSGQLNRGCIFKQGYNENLDQFLSASVNIDDRIAKLQAHERERSGISTLKIGYNRVFGYYIEVSKGRVASVPSHFVRKQTLTNAERYVTQELKELEEFALSAEENLIALEKELFAELVLKTVTYKAELSRLNDSLAFLDLQACFARVSELSGWVKPKLQDQPFSRLENVVHPLVQTEMAKVGLGFVPNTIEIGSHPLTEGIEGGEAALTAQSVGATAPQHSENSHSRPIHLITGPNMAGKSTIMRQVGLTHILAQMGCFVPCTSATIGMCDKIFTRIGSGDDLMGARSTFMVEMSETAQILKQATSRSLILMDEIGRGTSTWDGLALAWSILEEMNDKLFARTLFSTHYHELSKFCAHFLMTAPMQVEVIENPSAENVDERVVFTHRYIQGVAKESYGIHVARMAGLPGGVVERAATKLQTLTRAQVQSQGETQVQRQGIEVSKANDLEVNAWRVAQEIRHLSLESMTPLQVMGMCAAWQRELNELPDLSSKRNKSRNSAMKNDKLLTQDLMDPLF